MAWEYTARGNLVAVVTNGTAVLGLGNIGPLAGKPVMEGKACLFKKFADIDVFDLEVDAKRRRQRFIDIVAALEPTFGGINLEDIKAPECFEIEAGLRARMQIPVFHDDQHGTAIISGAALLNGAELAGKKLADMKVVVSGAGASAIACANFYVAARRAARERHAGRLARASSTQGRERGHEPPTRRGSRARTTARRTLADAMRGADVFLGLSKAGTVHARDAEDDGEAAAHLRARQPRSGDQLPRREGGAPRRASSRPGAATSRTRSTTCSASRTSSAARSTCAPRTINEEMKIAAARALAELAHEPVPDSVAEAYGVQRLPLRPRLHHPQAVRPARAVVVRAGGGRGGDGVGRRRG